MFIYLFLLHISQFCNLLSETESCVFSYAQRVASKKANGHNGCKPKNKTPPILLLFATLAKNKNPKKLVLKKSNVNLHERTAASNPACLSLQHHCIP